MDSTPVTFVLVRRETETRGQRWPCNCGGRDWGDAAANQEMPRMPSTTSWQGRILPRRLWRVCALVNTSIQASELQRQERIHFCCFNPLSIWPSVTVALGNYSKKEILLDRPQGACSITQQTPRSQGRKLRRPISKRPSPLSKPSRL